MINHNEKKAKFSILVSLLESFDKEEIEHFSSFIISPYFNTDQLVIKLFTVLKKNILGKRAYDEAAQAKVYATVFLNTAIDEKILNKEQKKVLSAKTSLLTKLAQHFLMTKNLNSKPVFQTKLLNEELLKKRQFKLMNRLYNKNIKQLANQLANDKSPCDETKKQVEERLLEDRAYYALACQVQKDNIDYLYHTGGITKGDNFSGLIKSMDMTYLIDKLELHITMLSIIGTTNNKGYDFAPMDAINPLLEIPDYTNHPLIKINRTMIKLMETKSEDSYFCLLDLLEKHFSVLSRTSIIDSYDVACNFCTYQGRRGKIIYSYELFKLYKIMDKKNILLDKDFFQIVKLKNIVVLSSKLGEFEWATEILAKYCPFVKKRERTSVYNCNIGIIEFYKSNYREAITHLVQVEKFNSAYDVGSRIFLIKAHYELDESAYNLFSMHLFNSTYKFIHKNKQLPVPHKTSYKNFIRVLIDIYKIRHRETKKNLESVVEKLEKMELVSDKGWLLEKIEGIGFTIPKNI